jgi:cobalt/nickel transport system permease protein
MLSRGWTGAMPDRGVAARPATWLAGLAPVLAAAAVLGAAVLT